MVSSINILKESWRVLGGILTMRQWKRLSDVQQQTASWLQTVPQEGAIDKLSSRTSCLLSCYFLSLLFCRKCPLRLRSLCVPCRCEPSISCNFNSELNSLQCIYHCPPIVSFRRCTAHFPLERKIGIHTW